MELEIPGSVDRPSCCGYNKSQAAWRDNLINQNYRKKSLEMTNNALRNLLLVKYILNLQSYNHPLRDRLSDGYSVKYVI